MDAAGPSAAPSRMRPAIRVGTEATTRTGSWATAHTTVMTNSRTRLEIRVERNPTRSPETLKRKKKELDMRP